MVPMALATELDFLMVVAATVSALRENATPTSLSAGTERVGQL